MDINYIAFDSLGVKSMCTQVCTDVKIIIDPGVSIQASSFPMSKKLREKFRRTYRERIINAGAESDIIVITHYHYDHHFEDRIPELYSDKVILRKDPRNFINRSQRKRAKLFKRNSHKLAKELRIADGKTFIFGKTEIKFTPPMWHSQKGGPLGYVIGLTISYNNDKILLTSDVNGPIEGEVVDWLIKEKPQIAIIDGPPTYLLGYMFSYQNFGRSVLNLIRMIEEAETREFILDHHLVRDYRYRELLRPLYKRANELGKIVRTAAEANGHEPMVLKAYRKYGLTRWKEWDNLDLEDIKNYAASITDNG